MIGARFQSNGRALTITGSYDGHWPDLWPGYDYQFDGDKTVHWISARAAAIRFTKLEEESHDAADDEERGPEKAVEG